MKSSNAARFTSKMGIPVLAAVLIFGSASIAAAQGNGNGGNPFDALWAEIENIQVQIDSLAAGNTDMQALIDAEAAARAAADTTLQGNIDAEAAARAAADTMLQSNANAEAAARAAADSALQNNIDSEAAARAAADTTLQSNINAETAARAAADTALQSQIDGINPGIVKGFYQTAVFSDAAGPGGDAFFGIMHCTNPDDKAINASISGSKAGDFLAGHIVMVNGPSGNGWFTVIRNAEAESANFKVSLLCADIT